VIGRSHVLDGGGVGVAVGAGVGVAVGVVAGSGVGVVGVGFGVDSGVAVGVVVSIAVVPPETTFGSSTACAWSRGVDAAASGLKRNSPISISDL
jgi:hypothetical protein